MLLDPLLVVRAANATFNGTADSSPTLQCKDIDNCRTLPSIVYGCLSTVFLCTWTALHLNVPREPKKPNPLRRVWTMLGALLGPEVVFAFAFGDWTDSSEMLRKILEYSPTCGWTETHAQFAVMGGFRIKYADGETELMREEKLFDCVKDGTIDLPHISEAQILERSKADPIAKTLTVLQTAWFVIQCIHRGSQRLPLTELEITTLGHTLINFFIYWFWWYKPLGISFPIDVPSKKPRPQKNYLAEAEGQDEKKESKQNSSDNVITQFLKPDNSDQGEGRSDALDDVLSFMSHEGYPAPQIAPTTEVEEKFPPTLDDRGKAPERDILADFKLSDDKSTPNEPKVDVEAAEVTPPRFSLYTRIGIKAFSVDADTLSPLGLIVLNIIFFIIGGSFGAMHCLAWNSQFPTRAEQYLWQISSLIVTIIGGTVMVMAVNISDEGDYWESEKKPGPWIAIVISFIYSSARISLLILALLQLRALPYAAYVTPSWSMFYPHIN